MEEEEKTVQEGSGLQQEGCELCVDQSRGVPRVGNAGEGARDWRSPSDHFSSKSMGYFP